MRRDFTAMERWRRRMRGPKAAADFRRPEGRRSTSPKCESDPQLYGGEADVAAVSVHHVEVPQSLHPPPRRQLVEQARTGAPPGASARSPPDVVCAGRYADERMHGPRAEPPLATDRQLPDVHIVRSAALELVLAADQFDRPARREPPFDSGVHAQHTIGAAEAVVSGVEAGVEEDPPFPGC